MSDIVVRDDSALMLDVGGVLSALGGDYKHDGQTIYKSAVVGAYCFIQCFKRKYPAVPAHVISRVNVPADDHWVVRFANSLGLTSVHMVRRRKEKGEVAKSLGITICIDDAYECVHSMAMACYGPKWQLGILFGGRPPPGHDDWVSQNTVVLGDFGKVAEKLGCNVPSQVWRWFGENGPPRQPHNPAKLGEAWELCSRPNALILPEQPRVVSGKNGPRNMAASAEGPAMPAAAAEVPPKEEPAASADVPPTKEEPAASAEVKTEGATSGADAAAPPPEVTGQAGSASSAVPAAASNSTAAPAEKCTAAPADEVPAAPAEEKPDWDASTSSSSEEVELEEDEEEEDDDDGNDDDKGNAAAAAPRGYAAKSQPARGLRLQSVPRRRAPTPPGRRAMSPPGGKKWVDRHNELGPDPQSKRRRRRRQRRRHRDDNDVEPSAPSASSWHGWQPASDKGWRQASGGHDDHGDWSSYDDWSSKQHMHWAAWMTQRLDEIERRTSNVPATPDPAARWGGRDPGSKWTAQKKARAEAHRARGFTRPQAERVLPPPVMCHKCGRNEPGAYCVVQMCRVCCGRADCPQHGQ